MLAEFSSLELDSKLLEAESQYRIPGASRWRHAPDPGPDHRGGGAKPHPEPDRHHGGREGQVRGGRAELPGDAGEPEAAGADRGRSDEFAASQRDRQAVGEGRRHRAGVLHRRRPDEAAGDPAGGPLRLRAPEAGHGGPGEVPAAVHRAAVDGSVGHGPRRLPGARRRGGEAPPGAAAGAGAPTATCGGAGCSPCRSRRPPTCPMP